MKSDPGSTILDRSLAEQYALCFKTLADATRLQIVSLLASHDGPMTVGEMTQSLAEEVGIGQSTVSHHLKALAEIGFVTVRSVGTSNLYEINQRCVSCFPTANDLLACAPVTALQPS